MDRRRFMTGFGLLAIGGSMGARAGFEAEPAIATEGPTARTATPTGTAAHAATVTFRTAPTDRNLALTIDDGPTREGAPQVHRWVARRSSPVCWPSTAPRPRFSWSASGRTPTGGPSRRPSTPATRWPSTPGP